MIKGTAEYVYTSPGRQRPVFCEGETIAYELTKAPEGTVVEWTDAPVQRNSGAPALPADCFQPLLDTKGIIKGATAIRVRIPQFDRGWCELVVQTIKDEPDADCIGAVTLINSRFAAVNRDMRVVAGLI